ncbi:MAG: GHMP kinase [Natronomonas sp.]
MPRVQVTTGARLHAGFCNLSLTGERLYGGVGTALSEPQITVVAEPAAEITPAEAPVERYAERACEILGVEGADVQLETTFPRHVGLGSGTQLALAVLSAVAASYDQSPQVRSRAPAMDRGGRSGVGVAAFERGGFIVDGGHPTERFTTERPEPGDWQVPPVVARHELPTDWRFLLVVPNVEAGRSGQGEDESMRSVVENADPAITDELTTLLVQRLLPAAAEGRLTAFGSALEEFGRLNGIWYADEQGGVYRPPVGALIETLRETPGVYGVGQSSWGPTVYGVTDTDRAAVARSAGESALESIGIDGTVRTVSPAKGGATTRVLRR